MLKLLSSDTDAHAADFGYCDQMDSCMNEDDKVSGFGYSDQSDVL